MSENQEILSPVAHEWHRRPRGHGTKRCPICNAPTHCNGVHRARATEEGDGPRWLCRPYGADQTDPPYTVPFGWRQTDQSGDLVTSARAVGEHFGVSEPTVREWKRNGMPWSPGPVDSQGGAYQLAEIAAWRETRQIKRQRRMLPSVNIGGDCPHHLAHLYRTLYVPRRLSGRAATTAHQYTVLLRLFAAHLGRPPELRDLTEETAAAFATFLVERQAPATVNKNLSKLLSLWRFACRRQLVAVWPENMAVREPKRIPQAWDQTQLHRLFHACSSEPGQIAGMRADRWWLALCVTLYYTGVRIGALLALRWQNVDLVGKSALFLAETQKQNADQRFDLPDVVVEALEAIRFPDRELVFPWPMSASQLWKSYSKILHRAGLPADRKSKFHRMRRTSASLLKAAGGDPTAHLGHSAPAVTKVYLDPAVSGERSQCHLLPTPVSTRSPAAELSAFEWV